MTADDLVSMYQKGALTEGHLVTECLRRLDPENPGSVLDALPDAILLRVLKFARDYVPQGMISNYGLPPSEGQVVAARAWIESRRKPVGDGDVQDGARAKVTGE